MNHAAMEEALVFDSQGEQLVGILHASQVEVDTAVLVIVGGPQYRAGSHRQFVQLGRALAAAGYPALRFDFRGMGDSSGAARDFEHLSEDIAAAIDALQRRMPHIKRVVLWGLCDGASAALLYLHDTCDRRVRGLCLLNPWVRSEASLARAHVRHYYTRRLLERDFWRKLLSGRVAFNAVTGYLQSVRLAVTGKNKPPNVGAAAHSYQQRMAQAWRRFDGPSLLLLSGNDYTAKEFIEFADMDTDWQAVLRHPHLRRHEIPDADHTFSDSAASRRAEDLVLDWLGCAAAA